MQLWRPAVAPVTRFVNASTQITWSVSCTENIMKESKDFLSQRLVSLNYRSYGMVDPEDYSSRFMITKFFGMFLVVCTFNRWFLGTFLCSKCYLTKISRSGTIWPFGSCTIHWVNNNSDKNRFRSLQCKYSVSGGRQADWGQIPDWRIKSTLA